MPTIKEVLTQPSADFIVTNVVDTFLTADGKSGWMLHEMRAYWQNATNIGAESNLIVTLSTEAQIIDPASNDFIQGMQWIFGANGVPANSYEVQWVKESQPLGPRVTVQPELYINVDSNDTTNVNKVVVEFEYEIVKLTDIEVLRLLAGGA